ncbi:hypothetical protein ACTACT_06605 [Pseudomonas syringae]|uniref:hypothetical protein n=1 Tax=Pseudomonas syringae TaxID=317 RepID=UPI003F753384
MNNWGDYAKTTKSTTQGGGEAPRVRDYALIKIVDNWLALAVLLILIGSCTVGVVLADSDKAALVESSKWFFDSAKLALGVFLGLLAKR